MVLTKGELLLRAFRDQDKATLTLLCNNLNIWKNVRDALPHPYTEKNAEEFIDFATSKDPQEVFAITHKETLVGCIGIHPQTDVYRFTAEIGYWIGEPYWGKGFATQALNLIIDYGFESLKMTKLYAGCFSFNQASQKVLLNAGFTKEAVLQKAVFKNEEFHDEIRYAIFKK
ncbi:MAG: GNAT family N-acetyltransferase [Flavobacteriaceae bacterium]